MKTFTSSYIQRLKCVTVIFIALLFLSVPLSSSQAQTSVAVNGGIGSAASIKTSIESTVSAAAETIQTSLETSLNIKEFSLDGIAYGLMKTILKATTASILNWINSGFQGSPAFVTDLDGFLLDVADQTAGEFIYGSDLNFLCSPFQLDVKIALDAQYQKSRSYQPQCTLTDVSNNIQGFIDGSFNEGSWPAWFELTQSATGDPGAAYFEAQAALSASIRTADGRELELLSANDFFLNVEICDEANSSAGNKKNCQTTTPGKIISEQLTFQLQKGEIALIEADEINEIVGALFAQLGQQALTGTFGLLGLGASSYSSNSFGSSGDLNFIDAIAEEDAIITAERSNIEGLPEAIAGVNTFIDTQFEIVERLEALGNKYNQTRAQFIFADDSGDQFIRCFNLAFPESFESDRLDALTEIENAETLLLVLNELQARFESSTSGDEQLAIVEEFADLQASGAIKSEIDVAVVEGFIEFELKNEIDDFEAELDAEVQQCTN